jgi:site-specific DNA-methyltransferase (adenine-specific)
MPAPIDLPTAAEPVRVWHGDCLDLLPTLPAGEIAAVVADPPYGMAWDTNSRRFSGGQNGHRKPGDGRDDWGDIHGDERPFDPMPWLGFPKVILWGFNHFAARLPLGSTLIWIKRNEEAFGSFLSDAEIAWMKGGHGVYCFKDLSMKAIARDQVHPSQKPVRLMRWCLGRLKLPPGSLVLDPYAGSGTTGVACLKAGYRCILIEREAKYIDVIHRRLDAARTPLLDRLEAP